MTPEDRMDMIRSMVDGLSDRLATDGGPPEDWARLINALGVLGDTEQAAAIWTEAQSVFADTPDGAGDDPRRGGARRGGRVIFENIEDFAAALPPAARHRRARSGHQDHRRRGVGRAAVGRDPAGNHQAQEIRRSMPRGCWRSRTSATLAG